MKIQNILFSILLLACFSCESLLEVEPEGNITNSDLNDAASIQQALNGAYYNLAGIHDGTNGGELLGGDFIVLPTIMAHLNGKQITWSSVDAPEYLVFANSDDISSINSRVAANWLRAFETINAINNILNKVSKIADTDERNRIEGEALAMRGIIYFEMVRLYARQYAEETKNDRALPLLTEPILSTEDLTNQEPATIEEVYTAAQNDLESASVLLLPFGKNGTNLSYYACQAFLTQLFMQKGDYESAAASASNVIDAGLFQLRPTPMEAFNNKANSSEDIFAIQQNLSTNTGDRSTGSGITAYYSSLAESGLGVMGIIGPTFRSSFNPNKPNFSAADLRGTIDRTVTPSTPSTAVGSAYYQNQYNNDEDILSCAKFLSVQNVLPVLRLGELLLNRSESIFEMDTTVIDTQALADLNQIRTRSGLNTLDITDFDNTRQFYDSLVIERKRELMYEGCLLYDLKRRRSQRNDESIALGDYFDPINPLAERFVLPVPQAERDTQD